MELYDIINYIKSMEKRGRKDIRMSRDELIDTYTRFLSSIASSRYVYRNVPGTLDIKALEIMLLYSDVIITSDPIAVYPNSFQYDVTEYSNVYLYQRFKDAGYTTAIDSDTNMEIGKDCFIIRHDETSTRLIQFINKSAVTLADLDISLDMAIINQRMTGVFRTADDKSKESINDFYKLLLNGAYGIIDSSSEGIFDKTNYTPFGQYGSNTIKDILLAKNNELRNVLKYLGIRSSKDKAEAVLSDESDMDNMLLSMTLDVGLESRRRTLRELNRVRGTDIECDINQKLLSYLDTDTNGEKNENVIEEVSGNESEADDN